MRTTALVSAIGLALYATPVLAEGGPRPFVELSAGSSWANKMGLTAVSYTHLTLPTILRV